MKITRNHLRIALLFLLILPIFSPSHGTLMGVEWKRNRVTISENLSSLIPIPVEKTGGGGKSEPGAFRWSDYTGVWRDRPQYRLFMIHKQGEVSRRTCRGNEDFITQRDERESDGITIEGHFRTSPEQSVHLVFKKDGSGGLTINGSHVTRESTNPEDRDTIERLMIVMCI